MKEYSKELMRFIEDLTKEVKDKVEDDLVYNMTSGDYDETEMFSFLKTQGYEINYEEFKSFLLDCKEIELASKTAEDVNEELDDDALESVAGGIDNVCINIINLVTKLISPSISAPVVIKSQTAIGVEVKS